LRFLVLTNMKQLQARLDSPEQMEDTIHPAMAT